MAAKTGRRGAKRCPGCGADMDGRAKACRKCYRDDSETLLAWQYDCQCGIRAYSFDGVTEICDTAGHTVRRGPRVIYSGGKFATYCPLCDVSALGHGGQRRDEMFHQAVCPREI